MELLWRFLLGGAIVSVFAMIGDVVRPKRFAGLFSAAPSVALATLAVTVLKDGPTYASVEARSMIFSSMGFILYVYVVTRLLAAGRGRTIRVSILSLVVWGAVALVAGWLLSRGSA